MRIQAMIDGHDLEITCDTEQTQMEDGSWWTTYYIEYAELIIYSRKRSFRQISRRLKMTPDFRAMLVDTLTDRERREVYV